MFTRPWLLLKIEELSIFVAALFVYSRYHFSWLLFAVLFFTPDIFMLGYLVSVRLGAALYNAGHAVFMPLVLFAVGLFLARPVVVAIAIIWFSHIAFDRLMGYGLKYPTYFKDTHLQRIA
jgi:hypothetical protein